MADFNSALPVILRHEGGLVDDPKDPGGITNFGISLRFLEEHNLDLNDDGEVNGQDIRGLTHDQAADVYRHYFWESNGYGRIPDQTLATKVFDVCVNAGPKRAHILLQRAVDALGATLATDGVLGPASWAAVLSADASALTQAMCDAQSAFYRSLVQEKPALSKFLQGWLKRAAWPGHA
jgi:lysozyme family protein